MTFTEEDDDESKCSGLRNPIAVSPVAANAVDIVVFCAYFVVLIAVAVLSSLKNRGSLSGYFLASRNMNWVLIGATIFASNIGSGHFIGLAGAGTASGIGVASFELHAIFILPLLGWIFAPVYIAAGVYTLPEYLQRRFGGRRIQIYKSCLSLALYIFTKISADLYSATIFLETALGLSKYASIVFLLAISALFTIAGGMTTVIWTDFSQVIIMLSGAFVLLGIVLHHVGGIDELALRYMEAEPDNSYWLDQSYNRSQLEMDAVQQCGRPLDAAFHLTREPADGNYPWPGIWFGLTIMATWYLCTDQVMVQRVLASKDISHAKLGTILACYLKIIPLFIIVIPGMAARVLFTDYVACSDPAKCECYCGSSTGCSNHAYTLLVTHLLPQGLRGFMLAVMVSALVSSLTSVFNSSATIFTMDLWRIFRKDASQIELMIVGRLFIIAIAIVSILWMIVVSNAGQLFHYIQKVTAYLAPPICAIFVMAIFWRRINEKGAFAGLMAGLLAGVIRFILEFAYHDVSCAVATMGGDERPRAVSQVHYFYFAIILFSITAIVAATFSLLTEPPEQSRLDRLTFWDRHNKVDASLRQTSQSAQTVPCENQENRNEATTTAASPVNNIAFLQRSPVWIQKSIAWLCGVEHESEAGGAESVEKIDLSSFNIDESPTMRLITNGSLVITIAIALFLWTILW